MKDQANIEEKKNVHRLNGRWLNISVWAAKKSLQKEIHCPFFSIIKFLHIANYLIVTAT